MYVPLRAVADLTHKAPHCSLSLVSVPVHSTIQGDVTQLLGTSTVRYHWDALQRPQMRVKDYRVSSTVIQLLSG